VGANRKNIAFKLKRKDQAVAYGPAGRRRGVLEALLQANTCVDIPFGERAAAIFQAVAFNNEFSFWHSLVCNSGGRN